MDIRAVSDAEKREYIDKVKDHFAYIRSVLSTVEADMESTELATQASAVWIGGNLTTWFDDFMTQIREIDKTQKSLNDIKQEIAEVANGNEQGKQVQH